MEAVGGIASVTGVVGFIGQIAGGCKVVKEIIGDIKNAPKDIIRLAECIKSIEESLNEDIPAAGAHMLEAIKSVENKLSSSAEIFGNSATGSKNKWKQFWHRLKYAANKEEIKELMHDLLKEMSTNIMTVPHVIHDSRDASITAQQKQTETLRSEMQKSQSHLVQIMSTTIAIKALEDFRDDLLLSLKEAMEECMQAQRLDVGPQVQFLVGKCLQRDLPMHSAKLAEQREDDVSMSSSSSTQYHVTPTSYHAPSTPDKMQRRKKGKNLISSTFYNYRFLGIKVSISVKSYANGQYQSSRSSSDSHNFSSTSVSIFLKIPWARRGLDLQYEMPSVPYSRESFISLRPRQLFENPRGDGLEAALNRGCKYSLISDKEADIVLAGIFGGGNPSLVSILEFINVYSGPRSREEVIYCCSNRLEILIKEGHKLNKGEMISHMIAFTRTVLCYTAVNYAFQTGAWKHLLEMLSQIRWDERKIQGLYDEETLIGVSTLMEGLQYHTIENAREEFLQRLLSGDDYSCLDTGQISVELATKSHYISQAITHACFKRPEEIAIPGSWPEEEVAIESISEKDLIMPWCLNFFSLTDEYFRYYECIHYGQYHTICHVPRKDWNPCYADMQLVHMVEIMESDEDMKSDEDSD
ncbi:hypothetical protein BOTNAR_0004g00230 [Botryotinia narcissicola]|uniref:Fungal N-terminal domain-containing protein n=1 Tax=Botryotinia narcissicola TaxID=278944 RepID=A0A4Z1J8W1_9HELO|nr:hypothetical protein BOTNAR_0004g00230 [Botryotinia narcissicola]